MDAGFLTASRFWAMVGVVVVGFLKAKLLLDDVTATALISLGMGFIGIRTIDRVSETLGAK